MISEKARKNLEERERLYSDLKWNLRGMQDNLKALKRFRGHSSAFKNLMIAIDIMQNQIESDHFRYKAIDQRRSDKEEVAEMQKSLNREKLKNAELEKKIEEAKTSSGLFIEFCRNKLGI